MDGKQMRPTGSHTILALFLMFLGLFGGPSTVFANIEPDKATANQPESEFCFDQAAQIHGVNPQVLRAIGMVESSLRPGVVTVNKNATNDFGLMGVNSVHLERLAAFGIDRHELLKPCSNVLVGAWLLRQRIEAYGNTWFAIGAYHSKTPSKNRTYQLRVFKKLQLVLSEMQQQK